MTALRTAYRRLRVELVTLARDTGVLAPESLTHRPRHARR